MASKKYGAAHRAERERWQTTIDNGEAQCAEPICLQARDGHGRRINPGEAWDLAHDRATGSWPRSLNTADAEIDQLLDLVDHRVLELGNAPWPDTHVDQIHGCLVNIDRDLSRASSTATELADQRLRTNIDGGCPHCHRETLVAVFNTWTDTGYVDVIRCDRDRATGRYEICICEDPWCFCKQDATSTSRRHSWGRDAWWRLAERITLHRAAAT